MATALTLTAPLKQDPESQRQLAEFKASFRETIQPMMEEALGKSKMVHFARVVVLQDKFIQVITEFDGDAFPYTEFFRLELGEAFRQLFSLVEGAPPWEQMNNPNTFFELAFSLNVPALGEAVHGGQPGSGYLFSAYGDRTVREIQAKLEQ